MKAIKPEALLVGEVWTGTKEVAEYVKNGELDMNFEFDLASTLVDTARTGFDMSVGTIQNFVWKSYPPNQFATFLTNHDQNRVMSVLGDDVAKARVAAAKSLSTFAPWMMGRSRERLLSGLDEWRGPREVGVIAGRVPFGIAMLIGGLNGESDGTVAVAETRLPGIQDHAVIAATHTGLPFSAEAIAMTTNFLRVGSFAASN